MKVFTLFCSKNDQYRHSTKSIEMINIIIFGWFTYVMSDITQGHLRSFLDLVITVHALRCTNSFNVVVT